MKLVEKIIEELHFEEVIELTEVKNNIFQLITDNHTYQMQGRLNIWNHIEIIPGSITRDNIKANIETADFLVDIRSLTHMKESDLAYYLEELYHTEFSDTVVYDRNQKINFDNLLELDCARIDSYLPGHTKIIMNKGRIGWGAQDLKKYAPEYGNSFSLQWVALSKELLVTDMNNFFVKQKIILDLMGHKNIEAVKKQLGHSYEEYFVIIPIHPWQWDNHIVFKFYDYIEKKQLIRLEGIDRNFFATSSLRTLSSEDTSFDIKLSLSILNTSCIRGIDQKYIVNGSKISSFIKEIINKDNYLSQRMHSLSEIYSGCVKHNHFNRLNKISYHFKEYLGFLVREKSEKYCSDNEIAMPVAALLVENKDESLINYLINKSETSSEIWMRSYFKSVVAPIYYLQRKHGVGLVAHGQNIIVVLKNYIPVRVIVKDFQGDLRVDQRYKNTDVSNFLDILPQNYLIHDVFTGHFITFLRYLARTLYDSKLICEKRFYEILGDEMLLVDKEFSFVDKDNNLLKKKFEKVLVNKVRYVHGYGDGIKRPLPILGKEIKNPLVNKNKDKFYV